MQASLTRLRESSFVDGSIHVDREAGILRDVKLLGFESKNVASCLGGVSHVEWGEAVDEPYRYNEAFAPSVLYEYEQCPVYIDHWSQAEDRPVRTVFGEVRGPYLRPDGIYAQEIHFILSHPEAPQIMEIAERFPRRLGMSHVAGGEVDLHEGRVTVMAWHPESVDLVSNPATTAGLFESRKSEMKQTVRRIVERSKRPKLAAILKEMDMAGGEVAEVLDAEVEVAPDASPEDALRGAIISLLTAKLESAGVPELEALLDALNVEDSITSVLAGGSSSSEAPAEEPPAEEAPPSEEEEPAMESLRKENLVLKYRLLLTESGRKATDVRIKALLGMDAGSVQELIESWPQDSATTEKPWPKPSVSKPRFTAVTEGARFADRLKKYAGKV